MNLICRVKTAEKLALQNATRDLRCVRSLQKIESKIVRVTNLNVVVIQLAINKHLTVKQWIDY